MPFFRSVNPIGRMRVGLGSGLLVVIGCGAFDRQVTGETIVARAASHAVTARELATMVAPGKYLPPEIVERWAWWWVEYVLFTDRIAAGDSLLDSSTVVQSRWPHIRNSVVDQMYSLRAVEQNVGNSRAIDSAFGAGNLIWIDQVLVKAPTGRAEAERAARRLRAEAIARRLEADEAWEAAGQLAANESPASVARTTGVIERGWLDPAFERAAFALDPGQTSPVTETPLGFHIIRRPRLDQVRDEFTHVVRDTLYWRMRDQVASELMDRSDVRIEDDAPAIMRRAGERPNRSKQSRERIGSYAGGVFTAADFVRWLQVLEIEVHEGIGQSGDGELRELARRMIRYDLEWKEAERLGIGIPESTFREAKQKLARDIRDVRIALDIASPWPESVGREHEAVRDAVTGYLTRFAENPDAVDVEVVPPFLADKLRAEARWSIRYDALDAVAKLVSELRRGDAADGN